MGYYISHMIGIRTGGVFSGSVNIEVVKQRVAKIIADMKDTDDEPDIADPSHCMSQELIAHKGSYIVLAGVFNAWSFDRASEFVSRLSLEFGTEVMHMTWDMEKDTVQCQIWLDGKPLFEVTENPIGRIMRHVV